MTSKYGDLILKMAKTGKKPLEIRENIVKTFSLTENDKIPTINVNKF